MLLAVGLLAGACVTVPRDDDAADVLPTGGALAAPGSPSVAPAGSAPSLVDPSSAAAPSATPGPFRSPELSIGFITLDGSQAFAQAVAAGVRAATMAAGVDLLECDPGWTREGVRTCARKLADAGVHGLISFQPFADLAAEVCRATGDAPTVGVVYEQGPCQVSLLAIDQEEAGRLGGRALGQLAAERWDCEVKALVELSSGPDDLIGGARMAGYREGYEEYCPLPADTRTLTDAQHVITAKTRLAGELGDIKGGPVLVAGVSDSAVLGAMAAASELGRGRHLWYAGQLAEPELRRAIACDERVVGSVGQFPERFGAAVVPTLLEAIEGDAVPPWLAAELELVTAGNVRALFPETAGCDEEAALG